MSGEKWWYVWSVWTLCYPGVNAFFGCGSDCAGDDALPLLQRTAENLPKSSRKLEKVEEKVESTAAYKWLCGFEDGVNSSDEVLQNPQLFEAILETDCGFRSGRPSKRFAYFKTHKTGSSTVANTLIRSAGRGKGLSWAACGVDGGLSHGQLNFKTWVQTVACPEKITTNETFDFEVRHVQPLLRNLTMQPPHYEREWPDGCDTGDGQWFQQVLEGYEKLMGEDVQIFTSIREPLSHLKSTLSFTDVSLEDFLGFSALWNPLAKDFRLWDLEDVDAFSSGWPFNRSSRLHVLTLENMSASMVMLRRTLQWDLQDVLYTSVVHPGDQSSGESNPEISADQLPEETLELDRLLYEKLKADFEEELKVAEGDSSFQREVRAHERILATVNVFCDSAKPDSSYPILADTCSMNQIQTFSDMVAQAGYVHC